MTNVDNEIKSRNYEIPNVYQIDTLKSLEKADADTYSALRIRCPHCQTLGVFPNINQGFLYWKRTTKGYGDRFLADIRICPNDECNGVVFVTRREDGNLTIVQPPELIEFDATKIPEPLTRTLREAISCHSSGAYRASAMMVRRLLEEICEKSEVNGGSLHAKLKELRSKVTLPEDLFDAMDELKVLGNDAAHIEAKSYHSIDKEEAELSIEMAQEILKALYQHKSLVERLKNKRNQSMECVDT